MAVGSNLEIPHSIYISLHVVSSSNGQQLFFIFSFLIRLVCGAVIYGSEFIFPSYDRGDSNESLRFIVSCFWRMAMHNFNGPAEPLVLLILPNSLFITDSYVSFLCKLGQFSICNYT